MRRGQRRIVREKQGRNRGGMRRRRGSSKERTETAHGRGHPVRGGDVGLLPHGATRGGKITRSDRRAVGLVENTAESVRTESLDRVLRATGEWIRVRSRRVDGRHAECLHRGGVTFGIAGGIDAQAAAERVQVQVAGRPRRLHDDHLLTGGGRADLFVRILASVLRIGGTLNNLSAGRVQHIKVVIVGGTTQGIRPEENDPGAG